MERSDSLIKFISFLVFIALLIYMGYALYLSRSNPLKTVLAVSMDLSEGIDTEGYAVREEQVLTAASGSVYVTAGEGEKVASGADVAVSYSGDAALERAESIRTLELQIEQIEAALSGKSINESARASILNLSEAVGKGDLSGLDAIILDINTYITGAGISDNAEELTLTLNNLQTRLNSLVATRSGTTSITAPHSGTFSAHVDGFESISPEDFSNSTTPDELYKMFSKTSSVGNNVFGKLVSGIKWYYVTVMDKQSAAKLSSSSKVTVAFSRTYSSTITMNVVYLGAVDENGECVVVLSSSEYLQDIISVRDMTAKIIFSASSGIQIPKEAIHIDDEGTTYIYVLKGLQAQRVDVEILGETGNYYMVSKDDTDLRIGDEIITKAATLYDGAVVAG